jgi:hypothetical protein
VRAAAVPAVVEKRFVRPVIDIAATAFPSWFSTGAAMHVIPTVDSSRSTANTRGSYPLEILSQQTRCNGSAGSQPAQATGDHCVGERVRIECQHDLSHARAVQRHSATDPRAERRAVPMGKFLDVNPFDSVENGQMYGLPGGFEYVGQIRRRDIADVALTGDEPAQLQQAYAQPESGSGAFEKTPLFELSNQSMDRALRDSGESAQLRKRHIASTGLKREEQCRRPSQHRRWRPLLLCGTHA